MQIKIGVKIKELRTQHDRTQEELATALGVTPQAISRWESENGYPDIEYLPAIAAYFDVTTDELLGVRHSEREARREEIYKNIHRIVERGASRKDIPPMRAFLEEFPNDENIFLSLADVICQTYMWEDEEGNPPEQEPLREAERIYRTIIHSTKGEDTKYDAITSLASLYKNGYQDERRAEELIDELPQLKNSREVWKAYLYGRGAAAQESLEALVDHLGFQLKEYIAFALPNGPETWNDKVNELEWVISLYTHLFGDNLLYYHERVGGLYRYIATYRVAQGRYDETLDALENMYAHLEKECAAKPGDKFTSPYTNELVYPAFSNDFHYPQIHNPAWYALQKMQQDRYEPLRDMPRFKELIEKLEAIAQ